MVQNFDECLFYLNFYSVSSSDRGSDRVEKSFTLLQGVFFDHNSPLLLEMLLQNGADANFYGTTPKNDKGILHLSIIAKKEDFVRVLLENGANPNPETGVFGTKTLALTKNSTPLKSIRASKNKPDRLISDESVPLFEALYTRNEKIIALLLEYGASVTKQNDAKLDALGLEACHPNHLPDLEIIKLLLRHGAKINALQGEGDNQTTALVFACQRGDIDSVINFIELGANPNQQVLTRAITYNKKNTPSSYNIPMTAFQKAVVQNHNEIVAFLMIQKQHPITFTTVAMTLGLLMRQPQTKLEIDPLTSRIIFSVSPMFEMIYTPLVVEGYGHYNKETIVAAVEAAHKQGEHYFRANKYERALISFYVVLLFGEQENRHTAFYNLANCYKKIEQPEKAIQFFEICMNYEPESSIGKFAAKQLDIMLPSASATIGFGGF